MKQRSTLSFWILLMLLVTGASAQGNAACYEMYSFCLADLLFDFDSLHRDNRWVHSEVHSAASLNSGSRSQL